MEPVEPCEHVLQRQFPSGGLQPLHEVGGPGHEHLAAVLDQRQADGGRKVSG